MDSDEDSLEMDNVDSGNVSSGDDGDDDFAMEVDIPSSQERQTETDDYQYEVLTTDEIVKHQREIIDEVNNVLKVNDKCNPEGEEWIMKQKCFRFQLSPTITRILLNHFKWDKEKLLEKYFDGNTEEFFKCAHVINPFNKPPNSNRQKVTVVRHFL